MPKLLAEIKELSNYFNLLVNLQELDSNLATINIDNNNKSAINHYRENLKLLDKNVRDILPIFNEDNNDKIKPISYQIKNMKETLISDGIIKGIGIYFDLHKLYKITSHFGSDNFKQLVFNMAEIERRSFDENKAIIYRGSSGFMVNEYGNNRVSDVPDSLIRFKKLPFFHYINDKTYLPQNKINDLRNVSLSFGNYLFAGMMYDNSACAASFMFNRAKFGYVISLDKTSFIESLSSLFFISPLNSLAAKFSKGEDFHPRTRIVDLKEDSHTDYGEEAVAGYYSDFTKNFILTNVFDSRKTFFNKINKFISEHIMLLTFQQDLLHEWILVKPEDEMQIKLDKDYKTHLFYEDKILNFIN